MGTVKVPGVLRNDGTGRLRAQGSSSTPNLRTGDAGLGRLSATGSSMFSSMMRADDMQPVTLMPACYASHRALHDVYEKNPRLFQGHGMPENRHSENFFPANFRHSAVTALAYQRRQTLLPEIEYLQ